MNSPIEFTQRKIKKNYRSVTGHFPSVKNNKSIAFNSKLEKELFLTLEFDGNVISYQEQPQIEIFFNGKTKIYSADCYIHRTQLSKIKDSIVEVKYTTELEKEKEYFDKKFTAIRESTNKLNLDFIIFTEVIFPEIYTSNIDFLYRYRLHPQTLAKYEPIIKTKVQSQAMSAHDLVNSITQSPTEYSFVANTIWSMTAHNILKTDLHKEKLTMNSIVELNHEHR